MGLLDHATTRMTLTTIMISKGSQTKTVGTLWFYLHKTSENASESIVTESGSVV